MKKVSAPQVVTTAEAIESPLPAEIQEALGELVGAAREGLLDTLTGERSHQLAVLKPRVGTDDDRARVSGAADAGEQLFHEPAKPALRVRRAFAVTDMQHLAGIAADREDRVIPKLLGVPVGRALLTV